MGKLHHLENHVDLTLTLEQQHFFLQHLPAIPHLRSLSVPFLADHVHGNSVDARELALQIVDIVTLKPDVELCYMGIANKCFEILENRRNGAGLRERDEGRTESHLDAPDGGENDDDDHAGSDEEEPDEDEEEGEDVEAEVDTESEDEDDADDDTESDAESTEGGRGGNARLRLREILFYDDKVAIFKARHGRL